MPRKPRLWYPGAVYHITCRGNRQHMQSSKYIHLNPVRANLVEHPLHYPWSSYPVYAGKKTSSIITTDKILGYFQNDSQEYCNYVERGLTPM